MREIKDTSATLANKDKKQPKAAVKPEELNQKPAGGVGKLTK